MWLIRLILFSALFFLVASVIRMFRSTGRRRNESPGPAAKKSRPAASPEEIIDVTYEDCESSKDETKERS